MKGLLRATFLLLILISVSRESTAQYFQLSSSGTSSNLDSLSEGFAAKSRLRLNKSLYRSDVGDSLREQLGQYRGKYKVNSERTNQYERLKQYRTKYNGDYRPHLNQLKSTEKLENLRQKSQFSDKYSKYQQVSVKAQSLSDQLLSGKMKLDSNTVFNNKIMQKYTDSLKRVLPARPTNPFPEMSEKQLVDEVNKKFQGQADSLRDSTNVIGRAREKKEWVDLNYAKLRSTDGSELRPMATSIVEKHVLNHVDSIRNADLKAARTKMEEKETSAHERVAKFRQIETFWQKSYLEAILAIAADQGNTFKFSPAWAYHISPSWSVGAGPNLTVRRKSSDVKIDVGARALTKYEILHRTTYFQVEDWINPGALSREHRAFTQHNVMAGGGYVIPLFSPITFNLSMMYKFYSSGTTENDGSKWLFRIGISTNKKKKQHE